MTEDSYIAVIRKALEVGSVVVDVADLHEHEPDLVNSNVVEDIVDMCESIDAPVVMFYEEQGNNRRTQLGVMQVLVGYEDESVADYVCNDYMENLMKEV